jgi:enoyl-CoA hydratase/carnithine racemase
MSFASREKAILSQWEVGVGMAAGGGPMARPHQLIGRNRALEVLLSSEDIRGDQAEAYGYVNRALPDADLDAFVEALATRIAGFDIWAIANTERLVNTSLPPDVELGAGWDACIASLGRPAAQDAIKALTSRGSTSLGMSKIGSDTTWAKSRRRHPTAKSRRPNHVACKESHRRGNRPMSDRRGHVYYAMPPDLRNRSR